MKDDIIPVVDKQAQIAYYEGLLSRHGANYLALDWNSRDSQKLRYQILREIFVYGKKTAQISVLDVGCGFGDLYGFFKAEGLLRRHNICYTGSDISSKLLDVARKKHPDAEFKLIDILVDKDLPKFDYVFCSGIFNIRTADAADHLEFVKSMLLRMYDLVNYGVAVNFLSEGALPVSNPDGLNSGRYFYFRPEEIVGFCRFICDRHILRHDYQAGDFTIYLLK